MAEEALIPTSAHCRACGYLLRGLASTGACPECGQSFDLADSMTWTRHPPRQIWRWVRWPLAILLLLVLASASGVGWLYWGWRQEQPAIEWARQRGIFPGVTFPGPGAGIAIGPIEVRKIGPRWLRRNARGWGCEWLLERANVLYVTLDQSPEAREIPQRLRWLEAVSVRGPGLTGEWLAELAEGNELKELTLESQGVNDAFPTRLGEQKKLEKLRVVRGPVPHTQITDEGLAFLSGFPQLRELYLHGTQIKGPGLQHLRQVPKLKTLSLDYSMIGDDAMPVVRQSADLEVLSLGGTRVTSSGVREIAGLKKLIFLDLSETQVDESVAETLATMPSLKYVFFRGLSPEAIERLRAALPSVSVYTSFPTTPSTDSPEPED